MTIGEKRPCTICNKEVEIIDEARHGNVVDQKLSCGHTPKRTIHTIEESLSLTEVVQGNAIKVQTIAEGVPILVSGSSGVSQVVSFSGFQGTINNMGQMIINSHDITVKYSPQHTETTTTTTTSISNLRDIFLQIDKSNSSSEDKEKIKGTLSNLDTKLRPLGGILTVAAPLVELLVNHLPK